MQKLTIQLKTKYLIFAALEAVGLILGSVKVGGLSFQELRNIHSSESAIQVAEMSRKWTTKQLHGAGSMGEVKE